MTAALPLLMLAIGMMARHASLGEVARFTGFALLGIGLPGCGTTR